jgi:hypothetical protein
MTLSPLENISFGPVDRALKETDAPAIENLDDAQTTNDD